MLRTGQEERSVGVSSVAKSMADCAGSASAVIVPVVAGNCSKIRVGGWNPGDEGTVTLTVTCEGGDGDSNCCVPHPFPACGDLACQLIVCKLAPHCCKGPEWDRACVDFAVQFCDICGP